MNSETLKKDLLSRFRKADEKFQELFTTQDFLTRLQTEIDRRIESAKAWYVESQISTLSAQELNIAKQAAQDCISSPKLELVPPAEEKRSLVAAKALSPTIQEAPRKTDGSKNRKSGRGKR